MQRHLLHIALLLMFAWLAPGASAAGAESPSSAAIDAYFPKPVYVALQNSGAIEVLPQRSVWEGFPLAHYVAVDPQGKRLVISGFGTGDVYVADAKTGSKLATLKIGELVQGVKIDPQGKLALAVDAAGGSVKVIDLASLTITHSIAVGKTPHNAVFSRDGKLAYVTLQGENKLAVLNMAAFEKLGEIEIPGMDGPHNLDLDAAGQRLWIRSHAGPTTRGSVALVDLAARRVLESIPVGLFHGGIDVTGSSLILTSDIGGNTVEVIDRNALGIVRQIDVGTAPHGVRLSRDGRWAYVTSTADNALAVIDMQRLEVVQRIPLAGEFPFWIAVPGNP